MPNFHLELWSSDIGYSLLFCRTVNHNYYYYKDVALWSSIDNVCMIRTSTSVCIIKRNSYNQQSFNNFKDKATTVTLFGNNYSSYYSSSIYSENRTIEDLIIIIDYFLSHEMIN